MKFTLQIVAGEGEDAVVHELAILDKDCERLDPAAREWPGLELPRRVRPRVAGVGRPTPGRALEGRLTLMRGAGGAARARQRFGIGDPPSSPGLFLTFGTPTFRRLEHGPKRFFRLLPSPLARRMAVSRAPSARALGRALRGERARGRDARAPLSLQVSYQWHSLHRFRGTRARTCGAREAQPSGSRHGCVLRRYNR